jgi:hypothetical protein
MLTQGAERTAAWDAGAPDEVGTVREDSVGEGPAAKITRGNPFRSRWCISGSDGKLDAVPAF